MEKIILDSIKFSVKKEAVEDFLQLIKNFKKTLIENNALPMGFDLFHDIEKEDETWHLYMIFESDKNFDIWEAKTKALWTDELRADLRKYFNSYNYSERIISKDN